MCRGTLAQWNEITNSKTHDFIIPYKNGSGDDDAATDANCDGDQ